MKPPTATVNGAETSGENGNGTEAGCGTTTAHIQLEGHSFGYTWARVYFGNGDEMVVRFPATGPTIALCGCRIASPPRPTVEGMGG